MDYGDKLAAAKRSLLTPPRWSLFTSPLTLDRPNLIFGMDTDNAYVESFNATVRLECLSRHWFLYLDDAPRKG